MKKYTYTSYETYKWVTFEESWEVEAENKDEAIDFVENGVGKWIGRKLSADNDNYYHHKTSEFKSIKRKK